MSHLISYYIEDKELIQMMLDFGWIVRDNTWTDCPTGTQKLFKVWHRAGYKLEDEI